MRKLLTGLIFFALVPALIVMGIISYAHAQVAFQSSLTGYWPLTKRDHTSASSNAYVDRSGNFNLATTTGSPTAILGIGGGGFLLASTSSQFIHLAGNPATYMSTATGTMNVWVYPTVNASTLKSCSNGSAGDIITDGATASGGYVWMGSDFNGLNQFCFGGNDGSNHNIVVTRPDYLDHWFMLTWVHSLGVLYVYIDGVQVSSTALGVVANQTIPMVIGQSATPWGFDGVVADASTYSRALSPNEVEHLYRQDAPEVASSTEQVGMLDSILGPPPNL